MSEKRVEKGGILDVFPLFSIRISGGKNPLLRRRRFNQSSLKILTETHSISVRTIANFNKIGSQFFRNSVVQKDCHMR